MILDKFELGDKHELRGGYISREEVSEFGNAQYEMEFTKDEIENLLEKQDGLSIVYHFVKHGLESIITLRDKINNDFQSFYNNHFNQKKLNKDRLLSLPYDGRYNYIDISNKWMIAEMMEDYSLKDVQISKSTFLNYGRLYFDNNNFLKKLVLTEGISHTNELLNRIEKRYDKLGFKKRYEGELKGMFGLRTELIPKEVIQFDKKFLEAFHSHSVNGDSIFFHRDSTQKAFFSIETKKYPEAERKLLELGVTEEKYSKVLLSTEIRELMSGDKIDFKDTRKPLYDLYSSDIASTFVLINEESNLKDRKLNLYFVLRELVKHENRRSNYSSYLKNILKNYQP